MEKKTYNKNLIKFNLKSSKNRDKKTQIFLIFSFKGHRLRYYTGKRIEPKHWDIVNQKAKSSYTSAVSLNKFLKTTANFVEDTYNELDILGERITADKLKEELNKRFTTANQNNVFNKFEEYIEISKSIRAYNTIRKYKTTLKQFREYADTNHLKFEFEDINIVFLEKLRVYLVAKYDLKNNSVAKFFKTLKSFLNWALERNYTNNTEFQKFKVKQDEGEIYFLTWDELMKLYSMEINNPKLDRVRDIFCFGCFTGLRFSDIMNLKQENINNDTIQIQTIKTKGKTYIPLNKYSRHIYEKYQTDKTYMLFQKISNQKMNAYLKELGKLAEINEPVQIVRYRGAERIEKTVPKFEVMTSHVARKTFITNAMMRGMSTEVIMDITTHNSYKSFKRYFKIVDEHKRNQMNKAFE